MSFLTTYLDGQLASAYRIHELHIN
uniref:Uncharacterized protein n=1 Tax=Rhizophora mucronata TaxID=61149 RepID=A0A2P2QKJ9_RHIMU